MKKVTAALGGFALLLPITFAAAAQAPEGFRDQSSTAGWSADQPEPTDANAASEDRIYVPEQPIMRGDQQFGWQFAVPVVSAEEVDRPLTELERLSISASGLSAGRDFYDAKSDNPLTPVAVTLRALDKITARYVDLTINIDETETFGDLHIRPRTCDKRPPEEVPEVTAFLEIQRMVDDKPSDSLSNEGEASLESVDASEATSGILVDESLIVEVSDPVDNQDAALADLFFSGWMFASSPALSSMDHPVYDVWVIDCKMVDPSI